MVERRSYYLNIVYFQAKKMQYFCLKVHNIIFINLFYFTGTLKGKVVFITGASSGIGETTALALAEHGVKLVLAARRKDELERVKTQCLGIFF